MKTHHKLQKLQACQEAIEWAETQASDADAWANCQRGDWMLWLIGRINTGDPWSDGRKPLVACAMECALLAKKYWSDKSKKGFAAAVKVIQKWTTGKASAEQSKEARKAMCVAYASATYAAYAAATAADADGGAAAYAAYAAATTAAAAADAAVPRTKTLTRCADIVRKHFPHHPEL